MNPVTTNKIQTKGQKKTILVLLCSIVLIITGIFSGTSLDAVIAYTINMLFSFFLGRQLLRVGGVKSKTAEYAIVYAVFMVSILSLLQFDYVVDLGTREYPHLLTDAHMFYRLGVELSSIENVFRYTADNPEGINHWGYPMFLGILFSIVGVDLLWGMLANVLIFVVNICLTGVVAKKLSDSDEIAGYTILLAGFYGQFVSTGMVLMKDGLIVFSVLLIALMLIEINKRIVSLSRIIFLLFGIALLAVLRAQYMFVPFFLYVFVFRVKLKNFILLMPVLAVLIWGGMRLGETYTQTEYSAEYVRDATIATEGRMQQTWGSDSNSFMNQMVRGYESWPLVKRITYMPVFVGIQYLTPFYIWDFGFDTYAYYSFPARNMNAFWFFIIGPLVFIGLYAAVKRRKDIPLIYSVGFSGIIMYAVPAFIRAGTVPRYAIPFVMLMLPCGGWLISEIKKDRKIKKTFFNLISFYYISGLLAVIFYLTMKL